MTHYLFHLRDGKDRPDILGMTLPDLKEAKREALLLAGLLLAGNETSLRDVKEWSIDVVTQDGEGQFTLTFYKSLSLALATQDRSRA